MTKERVLAFSDGVIAIIITIMVLELKPPHEGTFEALSELLPTFLSYVLSFAYVGIYWNNHHHFFQLAERVNGAVLWANLHLLFWLSLIPFTTAWMDETQAAHLPVALYGVTLLMPAIAWVILQATILRVPGQTPDLARAVGNDLKGKISPVLYITGIAVAFVLPWLSIAIYVAVALIWFIPDRRVERHIQATGSASE